MSGRPTNKRHISTSYAERQNLTMRMCIRRLTRLTNAFSKDLDHHVAAVALHYMYYNFARIHQTLRVTPALAASVSHRVWEISDIVKLVQEAEHQPTPSELSYNPAGDALGRDPHPFRYDAGVIAQEPRRQGTEASRTSPRLPCSASRCHYPIRTERPLASLANNSTALCFGCQCTIGIQEK